MRNSIASFTSGFESPELIDSPTSRVERGERIGRWSNPILITPNNFVHKSLSNWAVNIAVGCSHACRFCYVPSATTIKLKPKLSQFGIVDPDEEWGDYVLLRTWDEDKFLRSLNSAEKTAPTKLKPDGNRAVFYCSTTDPYQVIRHPDESKRKQLAHDARHLVRRSLELIRDHSTLNVRILTRSPLAQADFDLFASFGNRLLFGMSLPTLDNVLSKVYEPKAPAPVRRIETLRKAKEAGLNIYVAVAPTYPECGPKDIEQILLALRDLDPVTIFHEPINIRAENVRRIENHARKEGIQLQTEVFADRKNWMDYALKSLKTTQSLARELGLDSKLHLWPDKTLGSKKALNQVNDPDSHLDWLHHWWTRVSEWPADE